MAMNSSRYFYPAAATTAVDSLGSSFCKLHGTTSLRFLRYSSSIHVASSRRSGLVKLCSGSGRGDSWNRTQKQNQFKPSKIVLNHRKGESFLDLGVTSGDNGDGGGGSTMERIVEKLKKFGFVDDDQFQDEEIEQERRFVEEEERNPRSRRGGYSEESSPFGVYGGDGGEVKFPWEKASSKEKEKEELVNGVWTAKKEGRYSLAEMTLPQAELNRLRNVMFRTKSKMRIKGAGVTQAVVDAIQEKWKGSEIVRLKIEGTNALNMRRMHELLEVFTVLRSKMKVVNRICVCIMSFLLQCGRGKLVVW